MTTVVLMLVVIAAVLVGCFLTTGLEGIFGRPFLRVAVSGGGVALFFLGLAGLWMGPFGGAGEARWLAACGLTLAVVLTGIVRYLKTS